MKQSAVYIKRTLELDEYNVLAKFLDDVTPYTCDSPPQGVIERAVAFDQTLSPDNPVRWVTLTWISQLAINRGDWKLAEESSQQSLAVFRTPDSFIRYSVVLLKTGQLQAARALLNEQRQNWPTLDIAKYANIYDAAPVCRIKSRPGHYSGYCRSGPCAPVADAVERGRGSWRTAANC